MARQILSYADITPPTATPQHSSTQVRSAVVGPGDGAGSTPGPSNVHQEHKSPNGQQSNNTAKGNGRPPVKKRKRGDGGAMAVAQNQRGRKGNPSNASRTNAASAVKHWDEPDALEEGIAYEEADYHEDESGLYEDGEDVEDEDESRELTHEEIWDDSALIDAWDAANEEYEAMHGKNKRWKRERVHKSPLWYNIPPDKTKAKGKAKAKPAARAAAEIPRISQVEPHVENSAPIDFATFVPAHDPSLAFAKPPQPPPGPNAALNGIGTRKGDMGANAKSSNHDSSIQQSTGQSPLRAAVGAIAGEHSVAGANVSADEAFQRALGAMYWCGYWTAWYHAQRQKESSRVVADGPSSDDSIDEVDAAMDDGEHEAWAHGERVGDESVAEEAEAEEVLLVSTQR